MFDSFPSFLAFFFSCTFSVLFTHHAQRLLQYVNMISNLSPSSRQVWSLLTTSVGRLAYQNKDGEELHTRGTRKVPLHTQKPFAADSKLAYIKYISGKTRRRKHPRPLTNWLLERRVEGMEEPLSDHSFCQANFFFSFKPSKAILNSTLKRQPHRVTSGRWIPQLTVNHRVTSGRWTSQLTVNHRVTSGRWIPRTVNSTGNCQPQGHLGTVNFTVNCQPQGHLGTVNFTVNRQPHRVTSGRWIPQLTVNHTGSPQDGEFHN